MKSDILRSAFSGMEAALMQAYYSFMEYAALSQKLQESILSILEELFVSTQLNHFSRTEKGHIALVSKSEYLFRVYTSCLMKYVIDRFGEKVKTEPTHDDKFICYVNVRLSPTFYGWVFGFGGDIRILSPSEAVKEIIDMSRRMITAESI